MLSINGPARCNIRSTGTTTDLKLVVPPSSSLSSSSSLTSPPLDSAKNNNNDSVNDNNEEIPFCCAASPDQLLLGYWTSTRLHICTTNNDFESLTRLDITLPSSSSSSLKEGGDGDGSTPTTTGISTGNGLLPNSTVPPVPTFRKLLWKPLSSQSNNSGNSSNHHPIISSSSSSSSSSFFFTDEYTLVIGTSTQIILVQLIDSNKLKKNVGWLEWFLQDDSSTSTVSSSSMSTSSLPLDSTRTTSIGSSAVGMTAMDQYLTSRPWKLNILTTLTVDKDHTYTSLSVHSKGLCIGKSNGAIIVIQWSGEIIAEIDPRNALALIPSSQSVLKYSTNSALHAVTALETIYDQGIIPNNDGETLVNGTTKKLTATATTSQLITMIAGYQDGIVLVFSVVFSSAYSSGSKDASVSSASTISSSNRIFRVRIPLESITLLSVSPSLVNSNGGGGNTGNIPSTTPTTKDDEPLIYPLDIVSYIPNWRNGHYNETIIVAIAYSDNTVVIYQSSPFPTLKIIPSDIHNGIPSSTEEKDGNTISQSGSLNTVTSSLVWNFITSMPVSDIGSMVTDHTMGTVHNNNIDDNAEDIEMYLNSPQPQTKNILQSTVMGINLCFRETFTPDIPWICYGGSNSLTLSIVSMNHHRNTNNQKSIIKSVLSIWSFPLMTDANVSLQYVKSIQYNNVGNDSNKYPSTVCRTVTPPSIAWMKWGTSLFVTSTMLTGKDSRQTLPILSKIEFADMATEHLRSGMNTTVSAVGGQWAVSSTSLYQLVIVQPPFINESSKSITDKKTGDKLNNADKKKSDTVTKSKKNNSNQLPSPSTALSTAKPSIPTELGDAYILWRDIPISGYYFPVQQPVRLISPTVDGQRIAIAGKKGIAVYNVKREQWHVFSRPREEEQVCVRAMCWYNDRILFIIHSDNDNSGTKHATYRLQGYPHTHLDFETRLFDMEISVPKNHRIIGLNSGCTNITSLPLNSANPTTPKSQAAETLPCKVPWLSIVSQNITDTNETRISLYRIAFNTTEEIVSHDIPPVKVTYRSSGISPDIGVTTPFSSLSGNSEPPTNNGTLLIASTVKVDGGNGRISIIPEEITVRPVVAKATVELVANFDVPMHEIVSSSLDTVSECVILGTNFTEIDTTPEELRTLTLVGVLNAAQSAPVSKKKKPKALQSSSAPWLWGLYFPDMAIRLTNGNVFLLHSRKGLVVPVTKNESILNCQSMWMLPATSLGFANKSSNILMFNTGSSIMTYVVNEDRFPSHIDAQIVSDIMNVPSDEENTKDEKKIKEYRLPNTLPSSPISVLDCHAPYFAHAADRLEGFLPQYGACAVVVSAGSSILPVESSVSLTWKTIDNLVHDNRLPSIPVGISLVPSLPVLLHAITSDVDVVADRLRIMELASKGIQRQLEDNIPHIRTSLRSFLHDAIEIEVKASSLSVARQVVIDNIPLDITSSCSSVAAAVLRTLAGALRTYLKSKSLKVSDVISLLSKENIATLNKSSSASESVSATAKLFATRTLSLATALRLLRDAGPLPFLDIVTSVGRTMDEDHLQYLFPAAGEPRQLFNEALFNASSLSKLVHSPTISSTSSSIFYRHSFESLRYLRIAGSCILLIQEYSWRKEIHGRHGPVVLTKAKAIVDQSLQDAKELLSSIGLSTGCVDHLLREISSDQYTMTLPDDELSTVRSEIILSSQPPPDMEILGALLHLVESIRQYAYRLRIAAQEHSREEKALSLLGNKLSNLQKPGSRFGSIAATAAASARKNNNQKDTSSASDLVSETVVSSDTSTEKPTSTTDTKLTPAPAPAPSKGWSLFRAAAYFIGMGDEEETKTNEPVASVSSESISTESDTSTAKKSEVSSKSSTVAVPIRSKSSGLVQGDSIFQFLLGTSISILGRFTVTVNPQDTENPWPFEIGTVVNDNMVYNPSTTATLTNLSIKDNTNNSSNNAELLAVQKATTTILQSQANWLNSQLHDLHGSIVQVHSSSSSSSSSVPSLLSPSDTSTVETNPSVSLLSYTPSTTTTLVSSSFRPNDRLARINSLSLAGARISAIQSALKQSLQSSQVSITSASIAPITIECYRTVQLSILHILLAMFDIEGEDD